MSTVAIGSIAAAGLGAAGSLAAGSEQAGAAKNAQELQAQEAQNALNFQEKEWNQQQVNEEPFLKAGQGAIGELSSLLSSPGEGLLSPWTGTFNAPTAAEAEQTPGYEFARQQGELGVQNSAAASGGLLTGGTLKAEQQYGQNLADTNYQNVFQNALTQYQTAYNTFQNNQTNTYNRLAGVAGMGQTTAAQLGTQGAQAAGNVGNINLTTGAQQGNDINLGGAATASGYVGATNALTSGLNNASSLAMLQQLLQQQQGNQVPGTAPGQSAGYTPPGAISGIDPNTGLPYGVNP